MRRIAQRLGYMVEGYRLGDRGGFRYRLVAGDGTVVVGKDNPVMLHALEQFLEDKEYDGGN
jgi:hypothetical protein